MRALLALIPIAISLIVFPAAAKTLEAASAQISALDSKSNTHNQPLPPNLGIHGAVTFAGAPAGNVVVELLRIIGGIEYTISTTHTITDGTYSFAAPPSLIPSESYVVFYDNTVDPQFMAYWYTQPITQFTSGNPYNLGNFDIENITQISPTHMSTVSFPVSFKWAMRSTITDNYQVHLINSLGSDYYSPPTGYTDTLTLTSLPPGFDFGINYYWEMFALDPSGGYGVNYDYFQIQFQPSAYEYLPMIVR